MGQEEPSKRRFGYSQLMPWTIAFVFILLLGSWFIASSLRSAWDCCPVGWQSFQSHCYLPFNHKNTWNESERLCRGLGAHLASISNEAEQNFIIQFLDRRFSYFLGLTDDSPEDPWYWVDDTPPNPRTKFWNEGKPSNNQRENCVALVNDQDKWIKKDISFKSSKLKCEELE
ncbi:C-type lectin domain family 4 member D [Sorex araneus]|uniref:C-type lectin domain family 4 member D n=1 Tax=Sorex araneus TaxID=42254 RepID=UPI002433FFF0|nr:C-type lectin domain family 4 member D [Sorex araneus]